MRPPSYWSNWLSYWINGFFYWVRREFHIKERVVSYIEKIELKDRLKPIPLHSVETEYTYNGDWRLFNCWNRDFRSGYPKAFSDSCRCQWVLGSQLLLEWIIQKSKIAEESSHGIDFFFLSSRAIQVQENRCYHSVGLYISTWDQKLLSLGTFFLLWNNNMGTSSEYHKPSHFICLWYVICLLSLIQFHVRKEACPRKQGQHSISLFSFYLKWVGRLQSKIEGGLAS